MCDTAPKGFLEAFQRPDANLGTGSPLYLQVRALLFRTFLS
jgi:hypothetical protein